MNRVPDILVERLALGELPAEKAEEVRARLAAAGELDRLEAIAASNARVLDAYPVRHTAAQIAARPASAPSRRGWLAAPALLAAAAALFLAVQPPSGPETAPDVPVDGVTFRGDAQLMVYQVEGTTATLLKDGAALGAGDVLQLRYRAMPDEIGQQGAILSVDGRGAVTVHFVGPLEAEAPTLSRSYRLDDAPDFERFYYFAAPSLDVSALEQALRDGAPPEAGFVFTVRKEASR